MFSILTQVKFKAEGKVKSMEVRVVGKCSLIDISDHAFTEAHIYGSEMFSCSSHKYRCTKRNQATRLNQGWPLRVGVAEVQRGKGVEEIVHRLKWKGCGICSKEKEEKIGKGYELFFFFF